MGKLLIVISGPAGVGKRCIMESIRLYCKLGLLECAYNKIVLYNTREKRANEEDSVDYHYCYKEYVKQGPPIVQKNKQAIAAQNTPLRLRSKKLENPIGDLLTFPVREKDLQGIDLDDIKEGVNFLEIFDDFIEALNPIFNERGITVSMLFIAPFTENEMKRRAMTEGKDTASVVIAEMKERIGQRRKLGLSQEDDAEITRRTEGAVKEINTAFSKDSPYSAIVVNPCGEADPAWGTKDTVPTGRAREVVEAVSQIIRAQLESESEQPCHLIAKLAERLKQQHFKQPSAITREPLNVEIAKAIFDCCLTWLPRADDEIMPLSKPASLDGIVGFAFGNRPEPHGNRTAGSVNEKLAKLLTDYFNALRSVAPNLHVWVQWEIGHYLPATAIPTAQITKFEPVHNIEKDTVAYVSTIDVMKQVCHDLNAKGKAEGARLLVVAQPDHLRRCMKVVRSFNHHPIAVDHESPDSPDWYDPQSGQLWTRTRHLYLLHDMIGQLNSHRDHMSQKAKAARIW